MRNQKFLPVGQLQGDYVTRFQAQREQRVRASFAVACEFAVGDGAAAIDDGDLVRRGFDCIVRTAPILPSTTIGFAARFTS